MAYLPYSISYHRSRWLEVPGGKSTIDKIQFGSVLNARLLRLGGASRSTPGFLAGLGMTMRLDLLDAWIPRCARNDNIFMRMTGGFEMD
jgi:hypothetical protein